jgi:hypothetical protein
MPVASPIPASVGCCFRPDAAPDDAPHLASRGKGGSYDQAIPLEAHDAPQVGYENALVAAYPRPKRGIIDDTDKHVNREAAYFLEVIDTLATLIEELLSLCDEASSDTPDGLFRYRQQPYVRIPWSRLAQRWIRNEPDLDPAPLSLVARLARDHGEQLLSLAAAPRRLLVRQREEERIDRIQELDPHCLLDYIQRPGRNLAEKAGRNQTLLAVSRRETIDTLENRVLRDLLLMAERRARAYAVENKGVERSISRRLRKTDSIRRQILRLLNVAPITRASRLTGEVQPNYALLKDSRYQVVWRYWQEFRREERLRRELWSWSRRLWADTVRASLLIGMITRPESASYQALGNSGALLRREHSQGCFFLPSSQSMRFRDQEAGILLDFIHPEYFTCYPVPSLARTLSNAGADLAITRIRPKEGSAPPGRCLLLYTFLPMSEKELPREEMISSLLSSLSSINAGFRMLVVVGSEGDHGLWTSDDGRLSITRVSPLQPARLPSLSVAALALLDRKASKDGGTP